MNPLSLTAALTRLGRRHGRPEPPPARSPFELIVWENAAYLVPRERRLAVYRRLARRVGTTPEAIVGCDRERLIDAIAEGGMHPAARAGKLVRCAEIALDIQGGLDATLDGPVDVARRVLQRFPGIGAPGADKILLFTGTDRVLAPESNGLRVLTRLRLVREEKTYAATYRSVSTALGAVLPRQIGAVQRMHLLLQQHGQELCRRSRPVCEDCPLAADCPSAS